MYFDAEMVMWGTEITGKGTKRIIPVSWVLLQIVNRSYVNYSHVTQTVLDFFDSRGLTLIPSWICNYMHLWKLGMDKWFHITLYHGYNYWHMLELLLILLIIVAHVAYLIIPKRDAVRCQRGVRLFKITVMVLEFRFSGQTMTILECSILLCLLCFSFNYKQCMAARNITIWCDFIIPLLVMNAIPLCLLYSIKPRGKVH